MVFRWDAKASPWGGGGAGCLGWGWCGDFTAPAEVGFVTDPTKPALQACTGQPGPTAACPKSHAIRVFTDCVRMGTLGAGLWAGLGWAPSSISLALAAPLAVHFVG